MKGKGMEERCDGTKLLGKAAGMVVAFVSLGVPFFSCETEKATDGASNGRCRRGVLEHRALASLRGISICLRPTRSADVLSLYKLYRDRITMQAIPEFIPTSLERFEKRVQNWIFNTGHGKAVDWVLVLPNREDTIIGSCGLTATKKEGTWELGIVVNHDYWGTAVTREALLLSIDYGFDELFLKEVTFETAENNYRMRGLLEGFGVPEGQRGPVAFMNGATRIVLTYSLSSSHWKSIRGYMADQVNRRSNR